MRFKLQFRELGSHKRRRIDNFFSILLNDKLNNMRFFKNETKTKLGKMRFFYNGKYFILNII